MSKEDLKEDLKNFKKIWQEKCGKYDMTSLPSVLPAVKRIIVIGDIHGDWLMTLKTLRIAKLIDKENNWIGDDTIVVQVGDQVDRCRYSGVPCNQKGATTPDEGNDWKILQYFTFLHKQAMKKGGAVYSLIGNHELMNVNGDFRYVSYDGLREFDNYKRNDGIIIEDGSEARRWAFSRGNDISEFLACTRQMALIIGKNLFAHAGVLPIIAEKYKVEELNQLLSLYLLDTINTSNYKDIFNSSDTSPLWNRIYGNMGLEKFRQKNPMSDTDDKCDDLLEPIEKTYKIGRIYVGHTPLINNGIGSVCDNRIWLTDVGMSKAFNKFDNKLNGNTKNYIPEKNIFNVYDSTFSDSSDTWIGSDEEHRGHTRAEVLEILNDGETINVLK